jgi:hypothetical protein
MHRQRSPDPRVLRRTVARAALSPINRGGVCGVMRCPKRVAYVRGFFTLPYWPLAPTSGALSKHYVDCSEPQMVFS